jgi:phosphatidylglycerophosphate synthase
MPSPSESLLSTDKLLYDNLYKPLAGSLCFLDPNFVTVVCFLFVIPIAYGLLYKWPLKTLLILAFIRQSLDCMDGAIARACKKTSSLGAKLDIIEDFLSTLVLAGTILFLVNKNKRLQDEIFYVLLGIFLYTLYVLWKQVVVALKEEKVKYTPFESFLHDNTVVLCLLFIWGAKSLVDYK